jgi:hypothetical protein
MQGRSANCIGTASTTFQTRRVAPTRGQVPIGDALSSESVELRSDYAELVLWIDTGHARPIENMDP